MSGQGRRFQASENLHKIYILRGQETILYNHTGFVCFPLYIRILEFEFDPADNYHCFDLKKAF